jgi:hypothetical protein
VHPTPERIDNVARLEDYDGAKIEQVKESIRQETENGVVHNFN